MNQLVIKHQHALVDERTCAQLFSDIQNEIDIIKEQISCGYESDYSALYTPSDQEQYASIEQLVAQIKSFNPARLFLIGIGGSHLGAVAIIQALLGTYYNELQAPNASALRFYAADTIDAYQMETQLRILEKALQKGEKVVLAVVTKSGTTTETLVNAALLIELVKKYHPKDYKKYMVIITDVGSELYAIAQEHAYTILTIPKKVGGRYSVFTAVGLFPLMLLGIDCKALLNGASKMRDICLTQASSDNPAANSAAIIYSQYKEGKNIHDTFLYSPTLAMLGAWYRQLVGESLGKRDSRGGRVVHAGITPTVSIGTNDLHSVAQLYLGGPYDKFTTFVYANDLDKKIIPEHEFLKPIKYMVGKPVGYVKETIIQGVALAYALDSRPFIEIRMPEINAYYVGQFMMLKICEVLFLAKLMDVNPFDQPAVESYKIQTRKLLQK